MNKPVLVAAPHTDDEPLGCGCSILKHQAEGDEVRWLKVTTPEEQYVFDAETSASKACRSRSKNQLLAYEAPSETDFDLKPDSGGFRPDYYICIIEHAEKKLKTCLLYVSKCGQFYFPGSSKFLRALRQIRGAQASYEAAEAFMLIKQIND
ncbi:MAG: LmbE family protein [Flavobacteriaceae bacterium]|nr:LmbE family protein [Flavobacteriaceae bacterium]